LSGCHGKITVKPAFSEQKKFKKSLAWVWWVDKVLNALPLDGSDGQKKPVDNRCEADKFRALKTRRSGCRVKKDNSADRFFVLWMAK